MKGKKHTIVLNLAWTIGLTFVMLCAPVQADMTVTFEDGSAIYPAGTNQSGFISQSNNPLAPFSGQSVHFYGTDYAPAGSTLAYRYKIHFDTSTTIRAIQSNLFERGAPQPVEETGRSRGHSSQLMA
ncbi:hypothetical protein [Desulfoferrobacter suflitae]|uniref:hypothetical protein n=1 Tax=Desulfoferrobacter suflitae TaxID=2865782 RepID=UPI00216443AA|nr:hypothetical protein [Desulfoferrobacter suflitae]MCK8604344.1 hypothetical protein [Desulfoferrobacter suflitae]